MLDRRACPLERAPRGFPGEPEGPERSEETREEGTGKKEQSLEEAGAVEGGRRGAHPQGRKQLGPASHLPCLQEEGLTRFQGNLSAASKLPFLRD